MHPRRPISPPFPYTTLFRSGHRYGAPKDWDTIAIFYNADVVQAAGITRQQLDSMDWNPTDGGTFEKIIAHLTVDANGKRGDERSEEHTSELQSLTNLVCRLL